jgi:hypothetical protein
MSESEYANLEVNRVILHANASEYTNDDVVPKSYIDQVKSDIMGGLAPTALDTIKELADYMSDSTVAGGLVSQLSSISTSVDDETKRAVAAESAIESKVGSLETAMESADSALNSRIDTLSLSLEDENSRAVAAEAALESKIGSVETNAESALASEVSRAQAAEALKADLSGATFTGDVQLSDSYLQFGPNWRVKGSADGSRLVFEHKRNNVWKVAVPFISSV